MTGEHAQQHDGQDNKGLGAKAKGLVSAVDRAQQRRPWLAIAIATWKKFSDDQAGNLAALISYYAFAAIIPLLLVLVSILDIVVKNNPTLRHQLLNSALSQYPGISQSLVQNGLGKNGLALVIGILLTLYSGRGVATAMQNAMNTAWGVAQFKRPGFPKGTLRSIALLVIVGLGQIITITLSSIAGGTGHLGGAGAKVLAIVVSLLLNVGLFWLAFRVAASAEVATRDLRLSAILAAVAWQILQLAGGTLIHHATNSAYGEFGIVIGLLAWFYLQAQITLYVIELNVVRARKLWPRSLAPPPLTDSDLRAYQLYAESTVRRPEVEIEVRQAQPAGEPGRQ